MSFSDLPPLPKKKSLKENQVAKKPRKPSKKEVKAKELKSKANALEKFIEKSRKDAETEAERRKLKKLEAQAKAAAYLAKRKQHGVIPEEIAQAIPQDLKEELVKGKEIVFEPYPKQLLYLQADEDHVLAGGGRASGKSQAFIFEPLSWVGNPRFRGLFIRRNLTDLRDLIRRCQDMYTKLIPSVQWKVKENIFVFPSGATIEYGHLDSEQDVEKYRGQEYAFIGIDEISQIPEFDWVSRLLGSLRCSDPNQKVYFRATTNWTGIGIDWVKEYWHVDEMPQGKTIIEKSEVSLPDGTKKEVVLTKKWFNSTIFDNPKMANDAQYLAFLNSQPEYLKRAWLYGETSSVEGIAFPDFDKSKHVIEPFDIPDRWKKYTGCDYGRGDGAGNIWIAIDPATSDVYVYREFVANMKQHKEKLSAAEFASKCLMAEGESEYIQWRIIDGSLYDQRGSSEPSLYEEMKKEGFFARPADKSKGSRVAGKNKLHELLRHAEGKPKLYIFNTCPTLIKMFSTIPVDVNNAEDVDTHHPSDHVYDALRYVVMSRPSSRPKLVGDNKPIIYTWSKR